jgi:hypothetical protein
VAWLNDYEIKVVKLKGEFVWHTHEDIDELFLVVDGELTIQLRDGNVDLYRTGCASAGGVPNTSGSRSGTCSVVISAVSMRSQRNQRGAWRVWHQPTRYHRPLVQVSRCGSTRRRDGLPSRSR